MDLHDVLEEARAAIRQELERVLDQRLSTIEQRVVMEVDTVAAASRRDATQSLNNAVRRLKQAEGRDIWVRTVLDGAAPFCGRAFMLRVADGKLRSEEQSFFEVPLSSAPAFRNAAESMDTVVTAATEKELSAPVAQLLGAVGGSKLYLFPVVVAGDVHAILCAEPAEGSIIDVNALELLASFAGSSIEPLPASVKPAELVTIASAPAPAPAESATPQPLPPVASHPQPGVIVSAPSPSPAHSPAPLPLGESAGQPQPNAIVSASSPERATENVLPTRQPVRPRRAPGWDELSAADQQLHLRAQRFARAAAAQIVLHRASRVAAGRSSRNLYGTLREEIDAGRDAFRREFFDATPSMADYYHLEIVKTLAHGDPNLLGAAYPGMLRRRGDSAGL